MARGAAVKFRVRPGPGGRVWDGGKSPEPLSLPARVALGFCSLWRRGQRDQGPGDSLGGSV